MIRPYNKQMEEYGLELGKIGANTHLSPKQITAALNIITNKMDNLNKMDGQLTCLGDLYTWNARDEIPSMNAVYVIDATTGQQGWADLTFLLKNTAPTPSQ